VERALVALGLSGETLTVVHSVLMYAQKRGSTQGLAKIRERTVLPDPDCSAITTTRRSVNIAHLDGMGNVGMLVLQKAAEQTISLTGESGLALVTTNNTRSSTGAIGYYARQLANYGYIGIVLAGSPKVMAVSGGIDPVMGTNPIAIAIPTSDAPLVLDMATAATTWFALLQARDQQTPIANDVAVDRDGAATTSAEAAIAGALRTFGGNKGSGLALMFEMLTGPLTHASIAGEETDNRGNLIIGIDPAVVLGDNSFIARTDALLATIRSGRHQPQTPIRLPGDHSEALAQQCEQHDSITLDRTLYEHIVQLASD
jgi:LDH2 family malate/lactate/ureidoglycolate dehydrogenase